jgi:hypothetical protein
MCGDGAFTAVESHGRAEMPGELGLISSWQKRALKRERQWYMAQQPQTGTPCDISPSKISKKLKIYINEKNFYFLFLYSGYRFFRIRIWVLIPHHCGTIQ